MNAYAGSALVLVVSIIVLADAYPRDRSFAHRESLALGLGERSGRLDCKQRGSACRGFPPCCNDDVCYWENGFSPSRPGACVECVERGQLCQRDGQCCESLVCQKETSYTINGRCDVKLPLNSECHDNDQCESEYCEIHWYNNIVMGHGGVCANP